MSGVGIALRRRGLRRDELIVVAAGVLTVPAAYLAGARLTSRRAGTVAAALVACNPFLIWYSQEARSYALLVMLATASLAAFAFLLERPTRRRGAAWALLAVATLATHWVVARRRELQFTVVTLRASQPVAINPRRVAAVLRTTTLPKDELLLAR